MSESAIGDAAARAPRRHAVGAGGIDAARAEAAAEPRAERRRAGRGLAHDVRRGRRDRSPCRRGDVRAVARRPRRPRRYAAALAPRRVRRSAGGACSLGRSRSREPRVSDPATRRRRHRRRSRDGATSPSTPPADARGNGAAASVAGADRAAAADERARPRRRDGAQRTAVEPTHSRSAAGGRCAEAAVADATGGRHAATRARRTVAPRDRTSPRAIAAADLRGRRVARDAGEPASGSARGEGVARVGPRDPVGADPPSSRRRVRRAGRRSCRLESGDGRARTITGRRRSREERRSAVHA